jgi:hypothetical protein
MAGRNTQLLLSGRRVTSSCFWNIKGYNAHGSKGSRTGFVDRTLELNDVENSRALHGLNQASHGDFLCCWPVIRVGVAPITTGLVTSADCLLTRTAFARRAFVRDESEQRKSKVELKSVVRQFRRAEH